ncbi:MAG: M20/M25/M40 family metallo-hydrolase, partial [Gemmatimonadota bacterium]|nr:M20/M25/M40 family metallo-hydrolase [Gemmatimonadota bacterium]
MTVRSRILGLAVFLTVVGTVSAVGQAADPAAVRRDLTAWVAANQRPVVAELAELLKIPNHSLDSVNIRRNAALLVRMLAQRGFSTDLLEVPGAPPTVFGELRVPGADRTLVLYAHYDGQPTDPSRWSTAPFDPTLFDASQANGGQRIPLAGTGPTYPAEARIYARSASDDKSPIIAVLAALDALGAAGRQPSVNLKVFLDGEEEGGSDHMAEILTRYKDRLTADGWLFLDGPVHQSRALQVVFGVRGVMSMGATVYGPARPLHSGHYGNWAPNPAAMLIQMLASMRAEDGTITIANFHDDLTPVGPAERQANARMPAVEAQLLKELNLAGPEKAGTMLPDQLLVPAMNISGLQVGGVGALATNTIHTSARAAVDFRLVAGQRPERVQELVERHLRAHGWTVIHQEPSEATRAASPKLVQLSWGDGYAATRMAVDHPFSQAVSRSASAAIGRQIIEVPTHGGSLPMHHFTEILGVPVIVLPMVNHDNNQHAENENLRLQNLWEGIVLFGGVLARL